MAGRNLHSGEPRYGPLTHAKHSTPITASLYKIVEPGDLEFEDTPTTTYGSHFKLREFARCSIACMGCLAARPSTLGPSEPPGHNFHPPETNHHLDAETPNPSTTTTVAIYLENERVYTTEKCQNGRAGQELGTEESEKHVKARNVPQTPERLRGGIREDND